MGKPFAIGNTAPEHKYWTLFGACLLSTVLAGQISTLMSVYLPTVLDSLLSDASPSETEVNRIGAFINAIFILGWTIGGLSWGLIGDRIGRVRSLALSIGTGGLFTLLVSFAQSWEMVILLRLLAGLGVGGVLVISVTFLSEVWPRSTRNIMIGIVSIGFPVGIFSSGLVNLLSGWRQGFIMGLLPLLLGVLIYFVVKESRAWALYGTRSQKISNTLLFGEYRGALVHGMLIFGSMIIGLWAIFSWFPTWVQSLLPGTNGQEERSFVMMLLGIGGVTGGFLSGWVAKTIGVRRAMMCCFFGCGSMALLLFGFNSGFSRLIYVETAFLSLFFGISQGLLSFYIPQLFPPAIRASATGLCFNIGRVFTTVAVFSLGALVSFFGGYGNALLAFSTVFVAGFVILYFSKDYMRKEAMADQ